MPIYAYKCSACGHAEDVLQKISDAPLTVCPACGQSAYVKQVTAAGFQLKGSGWYVTDFRNNGNAGGKAASKADEASGKAASSGTDDKPAAPAEPAKAAAAPAASSAAPAAPAA